MPLFAQHRDRTPPTPPINWDHQGRLAAAAVAGYLSGRADAMVSRLDKLSPLYAKPLSLCLLHGPSNPVRVLNALVLVGSAAYNSGLAANAPSSRRHAAAAPWMQRGVINVCIVSAAIGLVCGWSIERLEDRQGCAAELGAVYTVAASRMLVDVLLMLHTATLLLWPIAHRRG
jgi:hypothetical protein